MAAGVTPAVAAGVAAAVTAGVVTGAGMKDGVGSGLAGVIGQRPQVMAQKPSLPSSAQAVQLPNAFYRDTCLVTEVCRKQCLQQACKKEINCKSCTHNNG